MLVPKAEPEPCVDERGVGRRDHRVVRGAALHDPALRGRGVEVADQLGLADGMPGRRDPDVRAPALVERSAEEEAEDPVAGDRDDARGAVSGADALDLGPRTGRSLVGGVETGLDAPLRLVSRGEEPGRCLEVLVRELDDGGAGRHRGPTVPACRRAARAGRVTLDAVPKTLTGEELQLDDGPVKGAELFLVDGNNLAYRAFFALPEELQTTDGQPTNALLGFTNMLFKLLSDYGPRGVGSRVGHAADPPDGDRGDVQGGPPADARPAPRAVPALPADRRGVRLLRTSSSRAGRRTT